MTGRERILAVLDRKPVDRQPYDLGGTDCSGVHVVAYQRLRDFLGLPKKPVECACLGQLIAKIDADVMEALQVDAEALYFASRETKIWNAPFKVDMVVPTLFRTEKRSDGSVVALDRAGKAYAQQAAGSFYFDPVGIPLSKVSSAAELERYDDVFERWDYPSVYDEPLEQLAQRARKQYRATTRAVVALWRMHYLQAGQLMRGYEQFFVDLMADQALANAILGKLHGVYMRRAKMFFDAFGDSFDVVFLTDDLGTQQSGLISPQLYRQMLFPYVSELVAFIKSHGKKVVMHSCGAVAEFVPFLIEMGVDALNPVQVSASGMNPRDLARQYGGQIAFWGGGCDTQSVLNAGDTSAVRSEVRLRLKEFGKEASCVFAQVHNIQYDVPPENIMAMYDEFRKQTGTSGKMFVEA